MIIARCRCWTVVGNCWLDNVIVTTCVRCASQNIYLHWNLFAAQQFKCAQTVVGCRFVGNWPDGLSYYYCYYNYYYYYYILLILYDKIKCILFSYNRSVNFPIIKVGNNEINATSVIKFLGTHLDKNWILQII